MEFTNLIIKFILLSFSINLSCIEILTKSRNLSLKGVELIIVFGKGE